jgi:uncharacterized protein (TIGR01244 family)
MELRRVTDDFSVSPQIAPGDLAHVKARGFALVVNNRPDGEEPGQPAGAEIETAVRAAGLDYRAIPVAGGFSQSQAAELAEALAGATGPVLAFCRSGTRSTLLWALAQAGAGGDPQAIAAAAEGAGYDIAPVRAAVEQLASRGRG